MKPFTIAVPQETLDDLRARLARVRWPDQVAGAGWSQGTELGYLQELVDYWRHGYDWRAREARLNRYPQFRAAVLDAEVHFVHVRGKGPAPLPLVLTHGWPSSFAELLGLVGPLTDPAAHGGDAGDAFDVVIPSLPGFGFSSPAAAPGVTRVDRYWRALMTETLGYPRFVAHGSDVGARITSRLGRHHGDVVAAIHLGSVDLEWPAPLPDPAEMTEEERAYLARVTQWERDEGAYAAVQSTRPQTLAYGLMDSPVGLAAWIVEKFRAWSDCDGELERCFSKDELLDNVMIYWVTGTIASSMRRYYDVTHATPDPLPAGTRIETPTGVAMFPGEKELVVPRSFAERCYRIVHWTDMPRGGHFPAVEQLAPLVDELRACFRPLRALPPVA